jgi:hypothetical protein
MLPSFGKLPSIAKVPLGQAAGRPGKGLSLILGQACNTSGSQPATGGCTPYRTLDALMFTSYLPT